MATAATSNRFSSTFTSTSISEDTDMTTPGLLQLPVDTICTILHRLKPRDLVAASLTCRTLHTLIDQPHTWLSLCRQWEGQLALSEWLLQANSAKCLFRLLYRLSPLVGVWAAEDLAPRGGLLYVTWERMAVVAYRIIPDWLDGNLISARLFTISAFPDGTTQLSLVTGRGVDDEYPLELPGVLVWESNARAKFHLQTLLPPSARTSAGLAAASPFAKLPVSHAAGNQESPRVSAEASFASSSASFARGGGVAGRLATMGAAERLKATFQRAGLGRFAATAVPPAATAATAAAAAPPSALRVAVPSLPPRPPSASRSTSGSIGTGSHLGAGQQQQPPQQHQQQQQQNRLQLEASRASISRIQQLQHQFTRSGLNVGASTNSLPKPNPACSTAGDGTRRLQLRALQYLTGLKQNSGSPSKDATASSSKRARSECDNVEASPDENRRLKQRLELTDMPDRPALGVRQWGTPQAAKAPLTSAPRVPFPASTGVSASAVPSASSAEWSLKRRAIGALHYAEDSQCLATRQGACGEQFAGVCGSSSGKGGSCGSGKQLGQQKGGQQPSEWTNGQTRRVPVPKSTYERVCVAGEAQAGRSSLKCHSSERDLSRSSLPSWVQDMEGLWTGVFGQHGVQILNVAVNEGEISATKIVGDPNVPGGQVSFKARIDSVQTAADESERWREVVGQARSLAHGLGQPGNAALGLPQLEFTKMLEGEGRTADYNFKNPQWMDGALLVDSAGRISFLWEELNFLVQMKRLHVEELVFNA